MGGAALWKTSEALNIAKEWAARNKLAIPEIKHILDDFLILEKCAASLERFLHLCEDIGVPMIPEKKGGS